MTGERAEREEKRRRAEKSDSVDWSTEKGHQQTWNKLTHYSSRRKVHGFSFGGLGGLILSVKDYEQDVPLVDGKKNELCVCVEQSRKEKIFDSPSSYNS